MNLLSDILNYIRRILKLPSNTSISDQLLIDYVNRFYIMDVDARIQLFDLKTAYQFTTTPGVDRYNMPLYSVQTPTLPSSEPINFYPVYQGFTQSYVNGIKLPFYTQPENFNVMYPYALQTLQNIATGDGTDTYSINLGFSPLIPGHVDIAGIIATGSNVDPIVGTTFNTSVPTTSVMSSVFITTLDANNNVMTVRDSGQFLSSDRQYGLLMNPGLAPFGNIALPGTYSITSNTIDYQNGTLNVRFPQVVPAGNPISVQCTYYQPAIPSSVLFYNNVITLRAPPSGQYLVELQGYLTPAAFLNTAQAVTYAYMSEYIARGAARKILSDTGDVEQFNFYEPLFKEQEMLVWKRSQRQVTATRTQTIFSQDMGNRYSNYNQGIY